MPSIGRHIQRYRKQRGWSQSQLAEQSGLTRQQICNFESDKHEPSAITLAFIANGLGVTADDLLADYKLPPRHSTATPEELIQVIGNRGPCQLGFALKILRLVLKIVDLFNNMKEDNYYETVP